MPAELESTVGPCVPAYWYLEPSLNSREKWKMCVHSRPVVNVPYSLMSQRYRAETSTPSVSCLKSFKKGVETASSVPELGTPGMASAGLRVTSAFGNADGLLT